MLELIRLYYSAKRAFLEIFSPKKRFYNQKRTCCKKHSGVATRFNSHHRSSNSIENRFFVVALPFFSVAGRVIVVAGEVLVDDNSFFSNNNSCGDGEKRESDDDRTIFSRA